MDWRDLKRQGVEALAEAHNIRTKSSLLQTQSAELRDELRAQIASAGQVLGCAHATANVSGWGGTAAEALDPWTEENRKKVLECSRLE